MQVSLELRETHTTIRNLYKKGKHTSYFLLVRTQTRTASRASSCCTPGEPCASSGWPSSSASSGSSGSPGWFAMSASGRKSMWVLFSSSFTFTFSICLMGSTYRTTLALDPLTQQLICLVQCFHRAHDTYICQLVLYSSRFCNMLEKRPENGHAVAKVTAQENRMSMLLKKNSGFTRWRACVTQHQQLYFSFRFLYGFRGLRDDSCFYILSPLFRTNTRTEGQMENSIFLRGFWPWFHFHKKKLFWTFSRLIISNFVFH